MAASGQQDMPLDHEDMTHAEIDVLVAASVSQLVRNLSPSETSQRELRRKEQLVAKLLEEHRWTRRPTSKEVQSSLEDLLERFRLEGMAPFSQSVEELAIKYLELHDPAPHVGWTMLDFLLGLSHKPVQNIRRRRLEMDHQRVALIAGTRASEQRQLAALEASVRRHRPPANPAETEIDWVALLSEDFLPPPSPQDDSSDSLSDWSDESDGDSTTTLRPDENAGTSRSIPDMASVYERAMQWSSVRKGGVGNTGYLPASLGDSGAFRIAQPLILSLRSNCQVGRLARSRLPQLAAPQPPVPATKLSQSLRNTEMLERRIHAHWWRPDVHLNTLPPNSTPLGNFAVSYVQFLNRQARGMLQLPLPKTVTESCLLREILFMFVAPASCCFFEFDETKRRISVRSNVSVCNTTAPNLKAYLELNVVPALEDMLELRRIIDAHTVHFNGMQTTGTLECFAYGLRDLLRPISQLLIAYEDRVVKEPENTGLLRFVSEFSRHFKQLRLLRHLGEDCILTQGAPHLRSAYLLCRLYRHTNPQVLHQKLATGLLLVSLKRYCHIIDGWWRRAKLEDRLNEFIVERWVEGNADRRGYVRERSVNESPEISRQLHACPLYQLLLKHALESGETQDLLANVNLLGEMLATSNESQPPSLYEELESQLFAQIKVYCGDWEKDNQQEEEQVNQELEEDKEQAAHDELLVSNVQGIRNLEFFALFTQPAQRRIEERKRQGENQKKKPVELAAIIQRLESSSPLSLKAEMPEALAEILRRRQSLANEYAMRAYREDLRLGENARFLRHTMMLESYYLLLPFYTSLFARIENTENWARDSLMSSQLYDVLSPHYPDFADNLHVRVISKVTCNSSKVYEALEALELVYEMPVALQRILNAKHMQGYNSVWRLMLKIKWAVWKLESLGFLRRHRDNPYEPLDLIGLTIRRLEILRFWLIYLINSLHTHIMQAVGQQFELRLDRCTNIRQLRLQHDDYIAFLRTHCLLTEEFSAFRTALDQIFHLIFVLDMEWTSCACYLGENDALSLDFTLSDEGVDDGKAESRGMEYLALNQVVEMEMTYIRCHQMLAEILNSLVYKQDHGFLTALEVAINTSVPH
ncbi:gamma-tubulin complex component 5 isoform X2 [Drosophila takahashii]|uniref:gamma-tubulin complex component 5 isoform X2 n=1 Tax=Drosophila takahashii TaxID=29030 RepID=UPI001CF91618|nr:uncharacterized protein LOC108054086 [Drosophila takahashii]